MKKILFAVVFLVLVVGVPGILTAQRARSDNWNNWVAVTDSKLGNISAMTVAWGGPAGRQRFVATRDSTRSPMAYSADGVNWTVVSETSIFETTGINKMIIWGGPAGRQRFVRVESYIDVPTSTAELYTSDMGENWNFHGGFQFNIFDEGSRLISNLTWGGPAGRQRFVGVGERMIIVSADGEDWNCLVADYSFSGVAWGGPAGKERFISVAVDLKGEEEYAEWAERIQTWYKPTGEIMIAYSANGEDWSITDPIKAFGNADSVNAIVWGGPARRQRFVAVGSNGRIAYSADGENWTDVANSTFGNNSINAIVWGGPAGQERFVAVGNNGRIAYSADGETWTAVPNSTFGTTHIWDIAWGGPVNRFVAVGANGKMAYLAFK